MNFKQKLGYMFIGCLFTIAGYIIASLGGITTHAQKDEQVFDEIVCRKLKVVNKKGQTVARISADEGTGVIEVFNAVGEFVAGLGAAEEGNAIMVFCNAAGKQVVAIGATEEGNGVMEVFNAAEKSVVFLTANEDGDGEIQTYKGKGWRIH